MIKIVHFSNGGTGGVQSVIQNLLQYSKNAQIENHVILTINEYAAKDYVAPSFPEAASIQTFFYQSTWNFTYTCKLLAELLPDSSSIIVAHDWLELGMVSTLGLPNPVVQVLHGDYDYYYDLAKLHESSINGFVGVSNTIANKLKGKLAHRASQVVALDLPVPDVAPINHSKSGYDIIFIGRCIEGKGYHLLPEIASSLNSVSTVNWHIYGPGSLEVSNQSIWHKEVRVNFYGFMPSETILKQLPQMDFLLLPSIAEGMPVAVIEAMKAGVIPLVNHLGGGVEELIGSNNERGYLINKNKVEDYIINLNELIKNKDHKTALAEKASLYARKRFHPEKCTLAFEEFFLLASKEHNTTRKPKRVYGSRLDQDWIPNSITNFVRSRLIKYKH